MAIFQDLKERISDAFQRSALTGGLGKGIGSLLALLVLLCVVLGFVWNHEPDLFDVRDNADRMTNELGVANVTGSTTTSTMIRLADTVLHKRGGYLSNDIMPPGVVLDNVHNWEFGVLVQIRDMARTMRNNLSRSQSQSTEDPGLVSAENQFYFDTSSWVLPDTEGEYRKGIAALQDYLKRLGDGDQQSAQFYARADNLRTWLAEVETRLGSLSQRLSTSVGKRQLDMSLAGDPSARQSTPSDVDVEVKTPWTELDDIFYEARGTTWALIHLLKAVEVDFKDVLQNKGATVSLQQIIRELEPTQQTLWSPVILNGDGFGMLANHSLIMGSHISRANAAIIDLRRLLSEG
ncbi:MAG: DUF2333 family protein [Pseudomonadales bacterium]